MIVKGKYLRVYFSISREPVQVVSLYLYPKSGSFYLGWSPYIVMDTCPWIRVHGYVSVACWIRIRNVLDTCSYVLYGECVRQEGWLTK